MKEPAEPAGVSLIQELALIARAAVARARFDVENGCSGYAASASPVEVAPRPATVAPLVARNQDAELAALSSEIGDCTRCELHSSRTKIVFGEGAASAKIVFVGEGPGREEDLAGRPLVGPAGELLDRIIAAMGLSRELSYICSVVKCRPPNNRVPTPEEQATCGAFVRRQLEIIGPKVVVALGATATSFLLQREAPISTLRGVVHRLGSFQVVPTFHPAYLLRNPQAKRTVWEDMQLALRTAGLPIPSTGKRS